MGNHIKSLGDIQVDNVHCKPYISQTGSFVVRGNQVCQAKFVLGQSVLAFPNDGLHLTCNSTQENFFHRFPRE